MMRNEFSEKLAEYTGTVASTIPEKHWEIIHEVYQFHPSIKDVGGKEQVAKLYADYGLLIFIDMLPRAKEVASLEEQRQAFEVQVSEVALSITQLGNAEAQIS